MDIGRVLARSLELAWRYKFLWLFGFIMALTGGGSGSNSFNYSFNRSDLSRPPFTSSPGAEPGLIILILSLAACFFLLFLVLLLYFRFVARGALVSSVREIESGNIPSLRSAWGEGHRYYGRLLGLGFLVNVPLFIVTILIILIAVLPFAASIIALISGTANGNSPTGPGPIIGGVIGFVLLLCCGLICIVAINLLVRPIYEFAVRAIVLENNGIGEGLARGYRLLAANLGSGGLLYLALIGARIIWGLAIAILAVPIGLVVFGVVAAAFNSNQFAGVLLAFALGIPFLLAFAFLEGLFQVFESNAWTEGYMALLSPSATVIAPAAPSSAPPAGEAPAAC